MMAHCSLGAREQIKVTFESICSNIFASIKNAVNQTAAILLGSQSVKLLRYQNGPVRLAKVFNGRWLVGCAAQWKLWEGLPGIQSPLGSICKNFNVSRHSFAASLYSKTAKSWLSLGLYKRSVRFWETAEILTGHVNSGSIITAAYPSLYSDQQTTPFTIFHNAVDCIHYILHFMCK